MNTPTMSPVISAESVSRWGPLAQRSVHVAGRFELPPNSLHQLDRHGHVVAFSLSAGAGKHAPDSPAELCSHDVHHPALFPIKFGFGLRESGKRSALRKLRRPRIAQKADVFGSLSRNPTIQARETSPRRLPTHITGWKALNPFPSSDRASRNGIGRGVLLCHCAELVWAASIHRHDGLASDHPGLWGGSHHSVRP